MTGAAEFFKAVGNSLEQAELRPYGPAYDSTTKQVAADACLKLCAGDSDKARTLWKLIVKDLGYMPQAACQALIRAANTENLVPDVEAPVPG